MHIFDVSSETIKQLSNVEPTLDKYWQKALLDIISKLDDENQEIIHKSIVEPKGIYFNKTKQAFSYQSPKTLKELLSSTKITNKALIRAIGDLLAIFDSPPPQCGGL